MDIDRLTRKHNLCEEHTDHRLIVDNNYVFFGDDF